MMVSMPTPSATRDARGTKAAERGSDPPASKLARTTDPPGVEPSATSSAPDLKPVASPTARVLALQSAYGNAVVARALLQRAPTTTPTGAATIAELDDELDDVFVDEEAVISMLGRLAAGDKAKVASGAYADPLARCLNTTEMVRAVRALGVLPLGTALEWVKAAAGGWSSIDYGDVSGLIDDAPQTERDVLKTTPWRDRFVGICTNATMLTAVLALRFDLDTKLRWMLEEGTDADLIERAIRESATADLAGVTSDAGLMKSLEDEVSSGRWKTIEKMLRSGLLGEHSIEETTDTGNTYNQWMALYRTGLYVTKAVSFIETGTFAAGGFAALQARLTSAVTSYLDNKYKVRIESPGGAREGDGDYPIRISVTADSSGHPLNMHGGAHGRSGVTESGGDIYELGQATESSVPDITLAHECGHLMLGASDEYANASVPARVIHTDHSLMGNFYTEGVAAAELKVRDLAHLATQVSAMFPGRTVSIVR
jgi:hypothetical protein